MRMHVVCVHYNDRDLLERKFYDFNDAMAFAESLDIGRLRSWAVTTAAIFGRLLVNPECKNGWRIKIYGYSVNDDDCAATDEFFRLEVDV